MPRFYRRRKKPNSVRGFVDDMTKSKIIQSAAKIAAKQSNSEAEAREIAKVDPTMRNSVANFLRYRLDMTEQEFLNQVNNKLSNMVGDGLNILHSKLDDIPPQNLAYAISIIMDKFLTVSGRPSNITASANVTLGQSDMSPDQVREILKGASKTVKQQPTKATEQKVVHLEEEDKEDKDG